MKWFRMYSEVLNNPKIQPLDGETFKVWVNLLCVTSQCDGVIVFDDISFHLRMSKEEALIYCKKLADAGLLDVIDNGYRPHGWDNRQYKSDTSAERTKKYRDRKKVVTVTKDVTSLVTTPDTEQIRSKKYKKISETSPEKPSWLPLEIWSDFCEHRRSLKKPMNPRAEKILFGKLGKYVAAGHSAKEILEESMANGWTGVFEPKRKPSNVTPISKNPQVGSAEYNRRMGIVEEA